MTDTQVALRIAMFNARYAQCLDSDALEGWPEFFTNDCVYRITTAYNFRKGYDASMVFADSRAMLKDRVASLREANIYERQRYRHIIGMPVVHKREGETFSAETPFVIVRTVRDGQMDLFSSGIYVDKLKEQGDQFLLHERIVVCDSERFDTLLAIPL